MNLRIWYLFNFWKFKHLGRKSFVKKALIITPSCISVGNNVYIQPNSRIEGVFSYEGVSFLPEISIDDCCTIQQNLHLTCGRKIYIGKNTAIAANVTITDINHPYENIDLPVERQPLTTNPVYIGDDCKIYNNVVILPGTYIGKHCVIGANSVVSGDFSDFAVIVGAPAKIIKRYCLETNQWKRTDQTGKFL
ncbi:acyltransferase [Pedobacter sp.]|uniref:acyltransferase n=1 Tax=Pedobacter sp. TaxID=1411316 RepID=UPI003BABD775